MDHHAGRLVDDNEGGIFVKNGERERFGFDRKRLGLGKDTGNEVPWFHMGAGLRGLVVEKDGLFFNQFL